MGWLGTLAYCTYLIHLPLMEASRRVLERGLGYSSSSRSSLAASRNSPHPRSCEAIVDFL
jgi:peptidoglycan/LPS O-acetylase OafA/YrhL